MTGDAGVLTEAERLLTVIEAHLSTGLGCKCGKWRLDTSRRPVDPRAQHRAHVAEVLAAHTASLRAELDETRARLARAEELADVFDRSGRYDKSVAAMWKQAALHLRAALAQHADEEATR